MDFRHTTRPIGLIVGIILGYTVLSTLVSASLNGESIPGWLVVFGPIVTLAGSFGFWEATAWLVGALERRAEGTSGKRSTLHEVRRGTSRATTRRVGPAVRPLG